MKSQAVHVMVGAVIAAAVIWVAWGISKGGDRPATAGRPSAASGGATSSMEQGSTLQVDVSGVRTNKGTVIGTLCREGEEFPSGCTRKAQSRAMEGVVVLNFPGLEKGRYALALYHDENSNSTLELGKEGIGFSNNVNLAYAPPDFDASSIEVDGRTRIRVRIQYSF